MRVYPVLVSLDGYPVGGGEIDTQPARYATPPENSDHPTGREPATLNTIRVMALAAVTVLAVWTADAGVALLVAGVVGAARPLANAGRGAGAAGRRWSGADRTGMGRARPRCPRGVPRVGACRRRSSAVPGEYAGDPRVGRRTVRVLVPRSRPAAPRARVAWGRVGRRERFASRPSTRNAPDVWRGSTSSASSISSGRATSTSVIRSLAPRTASVRRSNARRRTCRPTTGRCSVGWSSVTTVISPAR